jgi:hypothetical protein
LRAPRRLRWNETIRGWSEGARLVDGVWESTTRSSEKAGEDGGAAATGVATARALANGRALTGGGGAVSAGLDGGAVSAGPGGGAVSTVPGAAGATLSNGGSFAMAAAAGAVNAPASSEIVRGAASACRSGCRPAAATGRLADIASRKNPMPKHPLMITAASPTSARYNSVPTGIPRRMAGRRPRRTIAGNAGELRSGARSGEPSRSTATG